MTDATAKLPLSRVTEAPPIASGAVTAPRTKKKTPCKDVSIQVNTIGEELLSNESDFQKLTGVPSFALFHEIAEHVERSSSVRASLPTSSRVLLVSFNCTSPLSGISDTRVHRYLSTTLPILAQVMRAALPCSSKEEVMLNVPLRSSRFPRVRIVLDGTQVQIEKSHYLACRIKTYSHYKGCHTLPEGS